MKKPELLAPVGNMETLYAAIEAGCDAVYLSGKLYGARSYAANFTNDELISVFNYSHLYGVKVYVTINTLIYEAEVNNFIKYVDFLYKNNVDAVIIQDIGMFDLIRKLYPKLEIHISTQMHIHNLEGVKLMETLGASRVVLARETPIELIEYIKNNTNIELEVFVQGALCISYSGQCLMSSLIGGRSGNRGTCAQCCRQPYSLYKDNDLLVENEYLLSTRDLNSLDNIARLIESGIDSLKIEGRMKRPEYVYFVVNLYRKAIDNYIKYKKTCITEEDIKNLKKIFNRQFTKGFLFNDINRNIVNKFRPNHLGIEIGTVTNFNNKFIEIKLSDNLNVHDGIRIVGEKDFGMNVQTMYYKNKKVKNASKGSFITIPCKEYFNKGDKVLKTTDYLLMNNIDNIIKKNIRKVSINVKIICNLNKKIYLYLEDENKNIVEVYSEYIIEKSLKASTTEADIRKQILKLGDTVYKINALSIEVDSDIFIPVKTLNELRRFAINMLNDKRITKNEYTKEEYSINIPNYKKERLNIVEINNLNNLNLLLKKYDEIIVNSSDEISNEKIRRKLPRVNEYPIYLKNKIMIGELGSLQKNLDNKDIVSDFSLNVTNSYSVAFLHSLGVKRVTLSVEMNEAQIKKLIDNYHLRYNKFPNIELIVDANIEAMVLKYNILEGLDSIGNYYLVDKYNNKYKVTRENNITTIYNYKRLKLNNHNKYYDMGVNCLRKILY